MEDTIISVPGAQCECYDNFASECPVHADVAGNPYPLGVCCLEYDKSDMHEPTCGNCYLDATGVYTSLGLAVSRG